MPPRKKNAAAAELARKRWKGTTKTERSAELRRTVNTRWENATPEERAAQGKRLAEARAAARKRRKGKS